MKIKSVLTVLYCMASIASADVVLPKIMSSGMLLQSGQAAPVWGWADQGEEVTVSFAGQAKTATPDEKGKWMVMLDPLAVSAESRTLTIKGKNEIALTDVLVGEVWIASGQSNMEWHLKQIHPEEQAYAQTIKSNNLVRAFHVTHHLHAGFPLDDTIGLWKTGAAMADGQSVSAVGFFFAHKLQKELGVPVALLDVNWGGQAIEPFIPIEGYDALKIPFHHRHAGHPAETIAAQLKQYRNQLDQSIAANEKGLRTAAPPMHIMGHAQNALYNAMVAPLTPYGVKGAIWYQGESNRGSADYFKKLQALSAGWSTVFKVKDIPFYQVQIAPFDYSHGANAEADMLSKNIWAAQYKGAEEIPGMGIVAIHDVNINVRDIHPQHKRLVGERLSAQALKNQYGKEVIAKGPGFATAKSVEGKVVVSFKDIDQGLVTSDGQAPSWFELSADGVNFVKAEAVLNGNTVEVSSATVPEPKFVQMGWRDIAIPNLKDKNGWPVFSFDSKPVQ